MRPRGARPRFGAGFKPHVELLERRAMLSVSVLNFSGAAYAQSFDSLPTTGKNYSTITNFNSSGPYDAIAPTSGSTGDTVQTRRGSAPPAWRDGPWPSIPAKA